MGRTIAILNQKGGVGKTTVTLGLTSAAVTSGHRVLVVDLDPQGSSSWVLGVDPRAVEESVAEVLSRTPASRVIQASDWGEGVFVLPSSPRLIGRDHGGNPERLRTALAELVELKFFCGFGFAEIASMRGVSERTVQRDWNKARLFLRHVMQE